MTYNNPQEAIAACEADFERSWQEYLKAPEVNSQSTPEVIAAAKEVFRAGYMSGARFVSGAIVKKLVAHGQTHIIEPDNNPTS